MKIQDNFSIKTFSTSNEMLEYLKIELEKAQKNNEEIEIKFFHDSYKNKKG